MIIGVPKEIKTEEYRVALTPHGAAALVREGHTVLMERDAGAGSGFADADYEAVGAQCRPDAEAVFGEAELIVKVKEPIASEYERFRTGQTLFTYLHLAADEALTRFLLERRIRAFAYETLSERGRLPLLEPMSEVAGKMAGLQGALCLGRYFGGRGILAGGAVGTERARYMILGGGVAGKAAAEVAAGLGAEVTIFDINLERLHALADVMPANVSTLYSSDAAIRAQLPLTDVIIGTVLIPGARAPRLITRDMLGMMRPGSVMVDVSIDQGGCFESSRPTNHQTPTFIDDGVVHYCVTNMPGAYPRTSTLALTNATLPYLLQLARHGSEKIFSELPAIRSALNTFDGILYNAAVGTAHGIESQM